MNGCINEGEVVPGRVNKSSSLPLRLLGQLDETETAFDDFWERHRTKLEQCLQLRHFEQHFREVSGVERRGSFWYRDKLVR